MVDWNKTGIADVAGTDRAGIPFARHATTLEAAVAIVKHGKIKASHERQAGNALYGTKHVTVWLSPNDWQHHAGNVFGCVAFDYDWKGLIEEHGRNVYALQEADSTTPIARLLFSNFDHDATLGAKYNPANAGGPWVVHDGTHYRKKGCVLQVAVDTREIHLPEFFRITFIDQKDGLKGERRLPAESAARIFLCRVVGEQVPEIPNFTGLDPGTGLPHESLTFACRHLWQQLHQKHQELNGSIHHDHPNALALARAVLDRASRLSAVGRYRAATSADSALLASIFSSPDDLLLLRPGWTKFFIPQQVIRPATRSDG